MDAFGARLRAWRIQADIKQRELARRAGIDFTYLNKIEAGLVLPPSEDKIRALTEALGRPPDDADELIALAHNTRLPADIVNRALIKYPEAGALLRRLHEGPRSEYHARRLERLSKQQDPTPDAGPEESAEAPAG